ncbi:Inosine-5'-monophosphate dehydrogenase related protein IV [Acidilobus saccharovorans 345-15]|uniref:Inosine-5'-monophosphate dehydrogenase related protein IV n=1 Tax=Acidilobus saccharovorans (strain DSM 16705 / JCM 18335 / VKM B-2471 / 345-15) TaxID=666510 RepID=D9Q2I3_ACIS3|nr:CBS domain-containing protein [Acidilobus saccharovorans]ADL19521.1 Inosine-5'-monophosphate dehydrogenase related protein IV [Acidilobus saccharovorans 345-15]
MLSDAKKKSSSLGKIGELKILNVIDLGRSSKISVNPQTKLSEVRRIVREEAVRSVAVVDNDGRLLGIITRGTILTVASSKTEAVAGSLAEQPLVTLRPDQSVKEAVSLMIKADEWASPIVGLDGRFLGFFTFDDLISLAANYCKDDLKDLVIENYMTKGPVAAEEDEFISKIWNKMRELRYAGLPVVDSNGRLVGMITQYDLISKGYSRIHLESEAGASRGPRVKDVMTRGPIYLFPWSTVYEVVSLMSRHGYGRIPIVNSSKELKLVGIIDREDIARLVTR